MPRNIQNPSQVNPTQAGHHQCYPSSIGLDSYLLAEALVAVPLVDARPVAAELLVGPGAAVV